jgi:hypothetical protein
MLDLGQPMFDALLLAAQIEHMSRVSCRRAVRIPGRDALVDLDTRRARQLFEVKFWGQHHCVKYAAPRMAPHGSIELFSGWISRKSAVEMSTLAAAQGLVDHGGGAAALSDDDRWHGSSMTYFLLCRPQTMRDD